MCHELSNLSWLTAISTSGTSTISISTASCQPQQRATVPRRPIVTCTPISSFPVQSSNVAAVQRVPTSHQHPNLLLQQQQQQQQQQQSCSEAVSGQKQAKGKRKNKNHINSQYPRPSCSYSCLIAMAFKATGSKSMLVKQIYSFIETEYPFFKTATQGWKNSIRHTLSMHQNFIKLPRADGIETKKGFFWAINPQRQQMLNFEIERALSTMGRNLVEYGVGQYHCPIDGITSLDIQKSSINSNTESLMQPMSASFAPCQSNVNLQPTGAFNNHTTSITNSTIMSAVPSNQPVLVEQSVNSPNLPVSMMYTTPSSTVLKVQESNVPSITGSLIQPMSTSLEPYSSNLDLQPTASINTLTTNSATVNILPSDQQEQRSVNHVNIPVSMMYTAPASSIHPQVQPSLVQQPLQQCVTHANSATILTPPISSHNQPTEQPRFQNETVTQTQSIQPSLTNVQAQNRGSTPNFQNATQSTSGQYITLPPIPLFNDNTGDVVKRLNDIVKHLTQLQQQPPSNTQDNFQSNSPDDEFLSELFNGSVPEGAQCENQTEAFETRASNTLPTTTSTLQTSSSSSFQDKNSSIEEDTLMSGNCRDVSLPSSCSSSPTSMELITATAVPENHNGSQKHTFASGKRKSQNVKWAMSTYSPLANELTGNSRKRKMSFREVGHKRRRVEDDECSVDSFERCITAHVPPTYQSVISSDEESDTNSIIDSASLHSEGSKNSEFTFSSPLPLPCKRIRSKDFTAEEASPPSKRPALCNDEDMYSNISSPSLVEELEELPSPSSYTSDHDGSLSISSNEDFDIDIDDMCNMIHGSYEDDDTDIPLEANKSVDSTEELNFSGLCDQLLNNEDTVDMYTQSIDQLLEDCNFNDFNNLHCTMEKVTSNERLNADSNLNPSSAEINSTDVPTNNQIASSDSNLSCKYIDQVLKNTDFSDYIDPNELLCPVDKLMQSANNNIIDSAIVDTTSLQLSNQVQAIDSEAVIGDVPIETADLETEPLKSKQQGEDGNPLLDFQLTEEMNNFLNDDLKPWYDNIPQTLPELTVRDVVLEVAPATISLHSDSSPSQLDIDTKWLNLEVIPTDKMEGINELVKLVSQIDE